MSSSVRILCFHRVVPDGAEEEHWPQLLRGSAMTLSQFEATLLSLSQTHDFVDEFEATAILANRTVRERRLPACWITFDDGYRDNLEAAAPICASLGIRPTLFLTTAVLEAGRRLPVDRWYAVLRGARRRHGVLRGFGADTPFDLDDPADRARMVGGPEKRLFVTSSPPRQEELLDLFARALDAPAVMEVSPYLDPAGLAALTELGWWIGPHGHTHQRFTLLGAEALREELRRSSDALASLAIRRSNWLAYPDGAHDERVADTAADELAPRGYLGALTIEGREAGIDDAPWRTPRQLASRP